MDRYEEYKNTQDKSSFFRNLSSFDEKKALWDKLNDTEKKSLFSRLNIDDTKSFLSNMNSVDRKKAYESFDVKKLKGYYNSFSDIGKQKLFSELNEDIINSFLSNMNSVDRKNVYKYLDAHILKEYYNNLSEDDKKKMTSEMNEIDATFKKKKEVYKASDVSYKINLKNKEEHLASLNKEIDRNKVFIKKIERQQKLQKLQDKLKNSKPSALDKIGFISSIKTKMLKEIMKKVEESNDRLKMYKKRENYFASRKEKIQDEIDAIKYRMGNGNGNGEIFATMEDFIENVQLNKNASIVSKADDNQSKENSKSSDVKSKYDFSKLSDEELEVRKKNLWEQVVSSGDSATEEEEKMLAALDGEIKRRQEEKKNKEKAKYDFSNLSDEEIEERKKNLWEQVVSSGDSATEEEEKMLAALDGEIKRRQEEKKNKEKAKYDFSNLSDEELEEKRLDVWQTVGNAGDNATEEERDMLMALDVELKTRKSNATKDKVNNVQNKVEGLEQAGVYFENNIPVGKEFVVNGKPIDKLSDEEMVILAEIINNKLKEREKANGMEQEMGVSRTLSKGNVSFGLLVGIVILLLALLFMIF